MREFLFAMEITARLSRGVISKIMEELVVLRLSQIENAAVRIGMGIVMRESMKITYTIFLLQRRYKKKKKNF